MKAALFGCAVLASVLGVVGLLATIRGFEPRRAVGASLQQPGPPLIVMFDPSNLDANTVQLHQAMQDAIDGFAITPADRSTYFSAVDNVNGYLVNDWRGIITNVQPNADGHIVSIDVIPSLSSDWAACAIIVDSDYSEHYQVFPDGAFQYVGSTDPQGLAGQMPTMVGL